VATNTGVTGGHALPRDGPGSASARDGQLGTLLGHVARGDQVAFEAIYDRAAGLWGARSLPGL